MKLIFACLLFVEDQQGNRQILPLSGIVFGKAGNYNHVTYVTLHG